MELIKVDTLTAYSIEPGDMIDIAGDIVTVVNVITLDEGYDIEIVNDFGEDDTVHVSDDDRFDLYIDD
jgi:hypothetical protein